MTMRPAYAAETLALAIQETGTLYVNESATKEKKMSKCHTCAAMKSCSHVGNDVNHCVEYIMDALPIAQPSQPHAPLEKEIRAECQRMAEFLVAKNRAYGNSAINPMRIFAKRADAALGIDVRIDDKLNRIARGEAYPGDNDVKDLAGYFILKMIERRMSQGGAPT